MRVLTVVVIISTGNASELLVSGGTPSVPPGSCLRANLKPGGEVIVIVSVVSSTRSLNEVVTLVANCVSVGLPCRNEFTVLAPGPIA